MRKSVGLWPYLVLNTVSIINMMAMVSLLAEMRAERGFDETSLGIIVGAGYLATMAIQLSVGRFADIGWSKIMVVVASLLVSSGCMMHRHAYDYGAQLAHPSMLTELGACGSDDRVYAVAEGVTAPSDCIRR